MLSRPQEWRDGLWIGVFVICIHAAVLLFLALERPEYLLNYQTNNNPDARHYVLLGENVWSKGVYSRQVEPPYSPDIVRTPVYPLVAGGFQVLFGVIWPLYVAQAFFSVGTAWASYKLGTLLWGRRIGLIAASIYGLDLMLVILDYQAMSESLFIFLATSAVAWWAHLLMLPRDTRRAVWSHGWLGVLLSLAIYVRPGGLYLPLVMCVCEIALILSRRLSLSLYAPIVMIIVVCGTLSPWVVRNQVIYGVPRLTTADTINLAYFAAAGAYQMRYGIDLESAQARIAEEFHLTPLVETNNFWLAKEDVATMDRRQRAAAQRIILESLPAMARSSLLGVIKSTIAHNTADLAEAAGMMWNPPGMAKLAQGKFAEFCSVLLQNHPVLVGVFLWQILFSALVFFLGSIGVFKMLLRQDNGRVVAICLIAVVAYYVATIMVVGMEAYARHRSIIVPIWIVFAAVGLAAITSKQERRSPDQTVCETCPTP